MPRVALIALALLLIAVTLPAKAADAWLMTYGTADRVEERFGHNAIWIRDEDRGIDKVYNFGFFDFDTAGFYRDYLFGDLIYYAVARDPVEEVAYYQWRDRSVRAQLLDLDNPTIRRLTDWLEQRVQPETRNFRYDYYLNNCSTRIRDALDFALDGALLKATEDVPARLDFREHTRRLIRADPALYLGIQAALGRPVDRPRSVWDEMFVPGVVADVVADLQIPDGRGGMKSLVLDDRMLHVSERPEPADRPAFPLAPVLGLLVVGLVMVLAPYLALRRRSVRLAGWRIWLVINALAGSLLLFLWLATEHLVTAANENLLLINPLIVLLWRARGSRFEAVVATLVFGLLCASVPIKALGAAQWNYDLMLAFIPIQLAALAVWRSAANAARSAHP